MNADSNSSCQNSTISARDNGVERIILALYADEVDRTFDVTSDSIMQVDGPACELNDSDREYIWSIYRECRQSIEMGYVK